MKKGTPKPQPLAARVKNGPKPAPGPDRRSVLAVNLACWKDGCIHVYGATNHQGHPLFFPVGQHITIWECSNPMKYPECISIYDALEEAGGKYYPDSWIHSIYYTGPLTLFTYANSDFTGQSHALDAFSATGRTQVLASEWLLREEEKNPGTSATVDFKIRSFYTTSPGVSLFSNFYWQSNSPDCPGWANLPCPLLQDFRHNFAMKDLGFSPWHGLSSFLVSAGFLLQLYNGEWEKSREGRAYVGPTAEPGDLYGVNWNFNDQTKTLSVIPLYPPPSPQEGFNGQVRFLRRDGGVVEVSDPGIYGASFIHNNGAFEDLCEIQVDPGVVVLFYYPTRECPIMPDRQRNSFVLAGVNTSEPDGKGPLIVKNEEPVDYSQFPAFRVWHVSLLPRPQLRSDHVAQALTQLAVGEEMQRRQASAESSGQPQDPAKEKQQWTFFNRNGIIFPYNSAFAPPSHQRTGAVSPPVKTLASVVHQLPGERITTMHPIGANGPPATGAAPPPNQATATPPPTAGKPPTLDDIKKAFEKPPTLSLEAKIGMGILGVIALIAIIGGIVCAVQKGKYERAKTTLFGEKV